METNTTAQTPNREPGQAETTEAKTDTKAQAPNPDFAGLFEQQSDGAADAKTFVKLTLPEFIAPKDFPIGAVLRATVLRIVDNFTKQKEMEDTKSFWMRHEASKREFLFPITGVIGNALSEVPNIIGKTIVLTRKADRKSKKYGNNMFDFDVYVERAALVHTVITSLPDGTTKTEDQKTGEQVP